MYGILLQEAGRTCNFGQYLYATGDDECNLRHKSIVWNTAKLNDATSMSINRYISSRRVKHGERSSYDYNLGR